MYWKWRCPSHVSYALPMFITGYKRINLVSSKQCLLLLLSSCISLFWQEFCEFAIILQHFLRKLLERYLFHQLGGIVLNSLAYMKVGHFFGPLFLVQRFSPWKTSNLVLPPATSKRDCHVAWPKLRIQKLPNIIPKCSMGLVYLPTFGLNWW